MSLVYEVLIFLSLPFLKLEVIEKYETYRDLVEILPSCQLEVQLYQKKMQTQGANVDKLSSILAQVSIVPFFFCFSSINQTLAGCSNKSFCTHANSNKD